MRCVLSAKGKTASIQLRHLADSPEATTLGIRLAAAGAPTPCSDDTRRVGVRVWGGSWPGKDNAKGETGKTQAQSGRHFVACTEANILLSATTPCWRERLTIATAGQGYRDLQCSFCNFSLSLKLFQES